MEYITALVYIVLTAFALGIVILIGFMITSMSVYMVEYIRKHKQDR